jgi:hypothetical protein
MWDIVLNLSNREKYQIETKSTTNPDIFPHPLLDIRDESMGEPQEFRTPNFLMRR